MVRVPKIEASLIEGYLDVGVIGILAPKVASVADAHALVAAVKFSPEGNRGAAARSRAANYGLTRSPADYARHANEMTVTAALIETQHGIDNLDAIMTVPGLDYVAIGPNDLGFSLGIGTGMHDARVRALVESAQERIRAQRKPQLTVVSDSHEGREAATAGAKLIAVSDAALLASAGSSFLNNAREQ
jgi:4-hydroxy-2-oxoheptanedioate aldolase